jgi:cytoskeletal protein CcmA (bactofilin family)
MLALSLFSSSSSNGRDRERKRDKKETSSSQDPSSTSIISEGAEIEGILQFTSADLHIEGTVHGDISTDGRVVVSEGAEVQGTIHAHTIQLAGTVEGHVHAEDRLVLRPESDVDATLEADVLEIQPGASFSGEVPGEHDEPTPESPSASPTSLDSNQYIPVPKSAPENGERPKENGERPEENGERPEEAEAR